MRKTFGNKIQYEHECKIRDAYCKHIHMLRPKEIILNKEYTYNQSNLRVDLQTVDQNNIHREWEFKIYADYKSLGQILIYLSNAKIENEFSKDIIGVIAAFNFQPELIQAIRMFNLAIELVTIPKWLSNAGNSINNDTNQNLITITKFKNQEEAL